MDSHRFDDFTRSLSSGSSRRTLLRGMLGGAATLIGMRAGSTAAAPAGKVDICHRTGNGSFHHLSVNENALQAHLNHGDRAAGFCEGNFVLDFDTCDCACGLTGCDDGFELDVDTCSCQPTGPVCKSYGDDCGTNRWGDCVDNIDDGGLICVSLSDTNCDHPCSEGCPEGWVCVNDKFCGGVDHCHLPYT